MTKYITTYQTGRKLKNDLARRVCAELMERLDKVIKDRLFVDGVDYWRQRVDLICHDAQIKHSKCAQLHISEHSSSYDKEDPNRFISVYHSTNDTITAGSFIAIKVQSEKSYYKPEFRTFSQLNKQCEHLWTYARDDWEAWRTGPNGWNISDYFIPINAAHSALLERRDSTAHKFRTNVLIERDGDTLNIKSVGRDIKTVFTITFKPDWQNDK